LDLYIFLIYKHFEYGHYNKVIELYEEYKL
jgi:hypothetical protein